MNLSPQASVLIQKQIERYLRSLPQKKQQIEAAWHDAEDQHWSETSFEHFKTLVHRLAGSAGSYGLDELGRAAKCLDHLLGTVPHHDAPGQRAQALLQEVLSRLDESISANHT